MLPLLRQSSVQHLEERDLQACYWGGGRAFLVCLELVLSIPIRAYPSGALAAEAADQKRERKQ